MSTPSNQFATQVANPYAPVVAAPVGASAQALVQRESGEAQAAMMMARHFPRDERTAVDRILMACTRPSLAEDAVYQYARGGQDVSGASIRLAEELARQWGNMTCGVAELSRHGGQSEVLAYAYDQQTGFRDEKRFTVRHWRDTKTGGKAVTEERDIYELIANMGARRKRACILAIIPADVVESAVKQCEITLQAGHGEVTPERIKAMLEGFAAYRVTKEQIEKRIQRNIDSITPALLAQLRKIYTSLKDGMSSPVDWFEALPADPNAQAQPAAPAGETVADKLARELAAKKGAASAANTQAKADQGSQGAQSEYIPLWDEATALTHLRAQPTFEKLQLAWTEIRKDFSASNRELPLSVEATYNERGDVLTADL